MILQSVLLFHDSVDEILILPPLLHPEGIVGKKLYGKRMNGVCLQHYRSTSCIEDVS